MNVSGNILLILYYIAVAFLVGTVAQVVTGYNKRRLFTTFVLGFIGVMIGDLVARRFGLPDFHIIGISVLWSIACAVLFIVLFRLIRGRW